MTSLTSVRWALAAVTIAVALTGGAASADTPSPRPKPSISPTVCPSGSPSEAVPHCIGPTPAPPTNPPTSGDGGCQFWQVGCLVTHAINGWLAGLAKAAITPVFSFFGTHLLTTPDLSAPQMKRAKELWLVSEVIANTIFVIFIVIGGMLLMSGSALGATPKDVVPRLVLAFIAANTSQLIIGHAITVANGLSRAFLDYGADHLDPVGAADLIVKTMAANVATAGALGALICLVAVVLGAVVAVGYLIRLTLIMLLTAAAPLALVCHALPQTEPLAKLWWRAVTGMLSIQVAQSLIFATAIGVLVAKNDDTPPVPMLPSRDGLIDLLLVVTLLYVLARVPSWVSKAIWRGALGGSPLRSATRMLVSMLVLRRISRGLGGARARDTPRRPGPGRRPVPGMPPPPGTPSAPPQPSTGPGQPPGQHVPPAHPRSPSPGDPPWGDPRGTPPHGGPGQPPPPTHRPDPNRRGPGSPYGPPRPSSPRQPRDPNPPR
jgi:hypothetical protein